LKRRRIISVFVLTLILTSALNTGLMIRQSHCENEKDGITGKDSVQETKEATQDSRSENLDLRSSSKSGSTTQYDEDKPNFRTNKWSNLTLEEGNKTRLIVGVHDTQDLSKLQETATKHQATIINTVSIRGKEIAAVVQIPFTLATAFVETIRVTGLMSYVEPDMKVAAQFTPNDPYWNLQWGPQKIEADWAWNTTIGSSSVLVAVVDTGICYTHADLAPNYVSLGYDWVNNDPDPLDDHGHGTHCAGIIAAVCNNSVGIAGLAQVRVMAEKVLNYGGAGYWDWLANGIIHATDQGARIISMSLGGYGDSELVHDAIKYAYDNGVLIIAAAGNDNTNMKSYPAAYDEVIAVAATDQYDNTAYFSNWGNWIELAAPGVGIHSTVPWGYESWSGTSMACPHVSGFAALVISQYPSKPRDWIRLWLRSTADDLGDLGFDVYYGYGRINARKAIEQTPPAHELMAYEWKTPPYVELGAVETINASVLNFGENDETNVSIKLLANDTLVASTMLSFLASGNVARVSLAWNPTTEGRYNVTLHIVPVPGEANEENNVLSEYVYVGFPVKVVVLHSSGNIEGDAIISWQELNNNWELFGDQMIYIDYTTLNKDDITYADISDTEADVLIISCAYDQSIGWQFTDSEIDAISRYVHEGHGFIATAGTLYNRVPNNNKLAPLFGLNKTTMWGSTQTDLLHLMNWTHPMFADVPNPLVFPAVGTALPYDGCWDSNELAGGKYLALGHFKESAIVTFRGLAYISPWLEVIPPYYHHHLQLLYNAMTWSRYQKPEHELVVSLQSPKHLQPGQSAVLNATVLNLGSNNETDVELYLSIDGTIVNSTTIAVLPIGASQRIDYFWAPSAEKIYNVTAYSPPVLGEEFVLNNIDSMILSVRSEKFVLWDNTHDTDGDSLTGNYLFLYQLLDSNGFVADDLTSGPISSESLAGYDILTLMDPELDFSASEISDIQNWVSAGGALIAIIDGGYPQTLNVLLAPYGVQMTGKIGGYGTTTDIASHPITQDVSSIYVDWARDIATTPPSTSLAWVTELGERYAFLSATETEVVVISDSNIMDNDGLGMDDNTQLILNTYNWVGVKLEHDLSVFLSAPAMLKPGSSVLLNATVRNRGLNNESSIELQLLINDTLVSSAAIPELSAGSSYMLSYLWNPTIEDTYVVTAYAPPLPDEGKTENNIATKIVSVRQIKYVLFDQTHNTDWIHDYDVWVRNLTSRGYAVETHVSGPITPALLSAYDVFIIPQACMPYMTDELATIQNFVFNGGGLLIIGDNYPDIYTDLTGFAGIVWESGGTSGSTTDITPHLVTTGVSMVYLDYPLAIMNVAGVAQGLVRDPFSSIMLTVSEQFNGRVIGFADEGSLWNLGIGQADNLRLANNMIDWLTNSSIQEHDLAVSLNIPPWFLLGNSSTLKASVHNCGASNETNVELQLLINDTIVRTTIIPQLTNGAFYTITYVWTPMIEGTYNITAYSPVVLNETVIENNLASRMARVERMPNITQVYVSPLFVSTKVGTVFAIEIYIADVEDLYGYEFQLYYNRTVLECKNLTLPPNHFLKPQDPTGLYIVKFEFDNEYSATHGRIWVAMCLLNPEIPKSGSGILVTLYFQAVASGESSLDLYETKLATWEGLPVTHIALDGYVEVETAGASRDVALTSVIPSSEEAYEGWIVPILVAAANLGNTPENFNVTVYYDNQTIGTQTVTNLNPGEEITLVFNWNTSDVELYINHTIWAQASTVPTETNTSNNTMTDGSIKVKLLGDVNGDKLVDIFDIVRVAIAFGAQSLDPRWDLQADVNPDSIIDIFDIVTVALHLNESAP